MLKLKKKQLRKVNWLVREVIGSGVGSKLKGGMARLIKYQIEQ